MCTNFLLNFPNGNVSTYISARTLELEGDMSSSFYQVPRAQSFPLVRTTGAGAWLTWTNQYGFVGIASPSVFSTLPCFMDGMNERGLSAAALWLPGTAFPAAGSTKLPQVQFTDLTAWALGQYATVAEVQAALPGISVVGPAVPTGKDDDGYIPIHFIISDATGASLILEFVGGEMRSYTSSTGVLTNAPPYDWQLTNLANYANLNVVGDSETSILNTEPPLGSTLLGMPGDIMSASRFIRAATLTQGIGLLPADGSGWLPAPGGKGSSGGVQTVVNTAMQLIQMIQSTPYGTALVKTDAGPAVGDWTMWSVVRDHTNLVFYFTTAFNGILRAIDLTKLNFASGAAFPAFPTLPLLPAPASYAWYEDATGGLTAPSPRARA